MMMGHFPVVYPDELLYSVCARLSDRVGYPNKRDFIEEMFGERSMTAVVDLPSRLDYLVSVLPPGCDHTAGDFINHHSLLPFYGPFLPKKRVARLRADMRERNGMGLHMRAGIMASQIPLPARLRFCPECVVQDRQQFEGAYWHHVHQVPGVDVCPIHETPLQNSAVWARNTSTRYEFISAERALLEQSPAVSGYENDKHRKLLRIARDAAWLLQHPALTPGVAFIRERHLQLLADRGLATHAGRVYMPALLKAFKAYYAPDLLAFLHCELDERIVDHWLARLLHTKRNVQHPLYHLLLIQFLGCSLQDFFTPPSSSQPFGASPWPCLNPACQHYRQPVISKCSIKYSPYTSGSPIGTFVCECGFVYSRTGPDVSPEDRFKIGQVQEFGPVWEAALVRLWQDSDVSLRQIGRTLNVDPRTVTRYAERLGLARSRPGSQYTHWQTSLSTDLAGAPTSMQKQKEDRRAAWLSARKEHPQAGVTALRGIIPAVYAWLYRNDREWLAAHKPPRKQPRSPALRVDWPARDVELAKDVRTSASRLRGAQGRPKQITVAAIGRDIGQLNLLQRHLDKLPLTAAALEDVVESRAAYGMRRIQWVTARYREEAICPKRWQLVRRAGVARIADWPEVAVAIDAALDTLSELILMKMSYSVNLSC